MASRQHACHPQDDIVQELKLNFKKFIIFLVGCPQLFCVGCYRLVSKFQMNFFVTCFTLGGEEQHKYNARALL